MLRRILVICCLFFAGCFSTGSKDDAQEAPKPVQTTQRLALVNFTGHFATRVERAADDIAAKEETTASQRNAIFWKMRMIPRCRRSLDLADDQAAFVDQWILCAQMKSFFETGAGTDFFGESISTARDASGELESAIRALGPQFLDEARLAAAEKQITAFVKDQATRGSIDPAVEDRGVRGRLMSGIIGKPLGVVMMPLSAVSPTKGLDSTADAVHSVAVTADHIRAEIQFLPDQLRWQTEILLLELQEDRAVATALDSLKGLSDSAQSLSGTAADLPAELRREVSAVLTEVDEKQAGIQATLKDARATVEEVRATVEEVDGTLARVETLTKSVDETAQSLTKMGEAWTTLSGSVRETMEVLDKPSDKPPDTPPEKPGPPFDINDYGRTANDLTGTAKALSAVLAQVQELTKPEEAAAIMGNAESAVSSTVNRVLVSCGLFLLFAAALALGYRYVRLRMGPVRPPAPGT